MFLDVLGVALGRCLATRDGLTAAYLPAGVDPAVAEAMVRAANIQRKIETPFAILVTDQEGDESDPDCLRMSGHNALRFRVGDRLVVVMGRHPDLESFVRTFRDGLNPIPLS